MTIARASVTFSHEDEEENNKYTSDCWILVVHAV